MQTFSRLSSLLFILPAALTIVGLTVSMRAQPVVLSVHFDDNFSSGSLEHWQLPYPEDWTIGSDGPEHFLHMLRNREPLVPRRPVQFALLKAINVGSFTFQARMRREGRSLLMVFGYVNNLHFYYTHLSVDPGTKVEVHNGIFIVDGGPRRRIAGLDAPAALPDYNWHQIQVRRDAHSGSIEVFVDGERSPGFSVIDSTFNCGQVGLGSFDETGDFRDVHLSSNDAGCQPGGVLRPAGTN
jgi:hypothetical protein